MRKLLIVLISLLVVLSGCENTAYQCVLANATDEDVIACVIYDEEIHPCEVRASQSVVLHIKDEYPVMDVYVARDIAHLMERNEAYTIDRMPSSLSIYLIENKKQGEKLCR